MIPDITERLEMGAEDKYFDMLQPGGKLKCDCGKIFDSSEGTTISPNPYAMPVCPTCFENFSWNGESK